MNLWTQSRVWIIIILVQLLLKSSEHLFHQLNFRRHSYPHRQIVISGVEKDNWHGLQKSLCELPPISRQ